MLRTLFAITFVVSLGACGQHKDEPKPVSEPAPLAEPPAPPEPVAQAPEEEEPDVEKALKAAELANAIAQDPEKVETILSDAGMDAEQFENLLFEVAADPLQAEAYAKARETTAPETPQSGEPAPGEAEPSPEG